MNRPDSPPLETYCPLSKAATAVSCGILPHGRTLNGEYEMKLIKTRAHICVQNFRAELVMKVIRILLHPNAKETLRDLIVK